MFKRLTSLKNTIVSVIVSVLALVIGINLLSVYPRLSTLICTLAGIAVVFFGYTLIKYIIENRPKKKKRVVRTKKTWNGWRDLIIILILIGVIFIIIKGCTNRYSGVVEVDKLIAHYAEIDSSNVSTENVQTQNVVNQDVGTSNVTEQAVVNQNVVNQDVETSNVTEQIVVNQQVTTQTTKDEAVEEEAPKKETVTETPSENVHVCSVVNTNNVEATCTADGKTEEVCSCGKVISTKTIAATGHSWDEGKITTQATEAVEGVKTFTCTKCNQKTTEAVDKIAHTHKVSDTQKVDATCTRGGSIKEVCSCGKVISETQTAATGHSWNKGEITRESTENRTGIKTYTCRTCNAEKTEEIDKLEHKCKIEDEIEIEATCTTKGKIKYVCSCGEVLDTEVTPKLGHDYEVDSEKDPTSSKDGYIKYRCNNCDDTYKDVIPATGEKEESSKGENVYLTPSQTYLEAGVAVTVTTTGSVSNLEISYDPEVVEYKVVSDKKITITWLGTKDGIPAPTAVSIYDVTATNEESVIDLCSK